MVNLDSAEGKERAATADVGNAGEFVMRSASTAPRPAGGSPSRC